MTDFRIVDAGMEFVGDEPGPEFAVINSHGDTVGYWFNAKHLYEEEGHFFTCPDWSDHMLFRDGECIMDVPDEVNDKLAVTYNVEAATRDLFASGVIA